MSIPRPCIPSCEYLELVSSERPADTPGNRLVLRKDAESNVLFISTATEDFPVMTSLSVLALNPGSFAQVVVTGNDADAFIAEDLLGNEILHLDADQKTLLLDAPVHIEGNMHIDGQLCVTTGSNLAVINALAKFAVGQTTNDSCQGWYAEYSDDGGTSTKYRGIAYDIGMGAFSHFTGAATEPTALSVPAANAELMCETIATFSPTLNFLGASVACEFILPGNGNFLYTIPETTGNTQFIMSEGNQSISALQTFAVNALAVSGPILGPAWDSQVIPFWAWNNQTNLIGSVFGASSLANAWGGGFQPMSNMVRFGNNTAGVREFGWVPVSLRQGTYTLEWGFRRQFNHSICELYCTAIGLSVVADGYKANPRDGFTIRQSFAVPAPGIYQFNMRQVGKNPSSSDYLFDTYGWLFLVQTG